MSSTPIPPTVYLDAAAIRRIREDKKLTQLYVAKVVGVTTDTISRWENNRYPSIKRENALRLAEALEVEVREILKAEDRPEGDAVVVAAGGVSSGRRALRARLGLLLLLPALAVLVYFLFPRPASSPPDLRADRLLPTFAAPNTAIPVRIRVETGDRIKGFIVREHFPRGWQLIEASPPPSSLDNEEGVARWIVKPGESRPVISYMIRVAEGLPQGRTAAFAGEVVAHGNGHGTPLAVGGRDSVRVASFQWADLDGDHRIDDGEMLEASDVVEEMHGVHIDWQQLEDIWDAGGYRWDEPRGRFVPARPATTAAP